MLLPRKAMTRRTLLRGLLGGTAVTVALPVLDAMLDDTGRALAGGGDLPTRFGVWFWGNGVRKEHWNPDGLGRDWRPRAELAPLVDAGLRDDLNIVSGLHIKTATHPHHSGMAGIMTGARYEQVGTTRDTIVSTFAHPSVDQIAAAHFEGRTPFRSIELAVCRFWGTDEGTTFQHLSHNGPNNVNPSEYDARTAFRRLFGMAQDAQVDHVRRSVLDAVMGQIRGLQARVGVRDRARLEQHFESVRTLEQRLAGEGPLCTPPTEPGGYPPIDGQEQIAEKNLAMSRIMATALACDLTRAFSVMFSTAGSGVIVWPAGAQNSLHQMAHDEANPQPLVHAAVVYMMSQLGVFLTTLKEMPEGDGTLLDHCAILCTSELSEGWNHTNDEFPVIIAGGGGGRLRGGVHARLPDGNASRAPLTALRAAGVPMDAFGHGPGRVEDSISDIEV